MIGMFASSEVVDYNTWMNAMLLAFDERNASPLANLGSLGSGFNATATNTRRFTNSSSKAHIWLPIGVSGGQVTTTSTIPTVSGATTVSMRVAVTAEDYTPSNNMVYLAFGTGGTGGSVRFLTLPGGNIYFGIRGPSGGEVYYTSSNPGFTNGSTVCVWALWQASTGLCTFYYKNTTEETYLEDMNSDSGWTQIGFSQAAIGGSSPASIVNTDYKLGLGSYSSGTTNGLGGKFHAGSVHTATSGSPVFLVDSSVLTDEGATTFSALTGEGITIARGGAAYRPEVVLPGSQSRAFDGTSSYLEVPHDNSLNAGTSNVLTPWIFCRVSATPVSSGPYISKRDGVAPNSGWNVLSNGAAYTFAVVVDEGASQVNRISTGAVVQNQLTLFGSVMDRVNQQLRTFIDGTVYTNVSLSALGDVSNSLPVRVGRNPNVASGGQNFRLYAWGIYPGVLTGPQLASLRDAILKGN